MPKTGADGKANTQGEPVFGKAALKAQVKELSEMSTSDAGQLSLAKLDAPQTYKWLLAPDDVKTLDALVKKRLSGASKSEASTATSSSDPAKKKKKVHDPGSASVMKFF